MHSVVGFKTFIFHFAGGFVTMTGQLITDRYGSNVFEASNTRSEKLLRYMDFDSQIDQL